MYFGLLSALIITLILIVLLSHYSPAYSTPQLNLSYHKSNFLFHLDGSASFWVTGTDPFLETMCPVLEYESVDEFLKRSNRNW